MKFSAVKSCISIILCCIIVLSFSVISFAQGETTTAPSTQEPVVNVNQSFGVNETLEAINNIQTELFCISKYGNCINYPENSAEGILSASEMGADMILIKVKKTADNQIVLFSDDELSRMCVDKNGKTVNKEISQVKYDELKKYFLRNGKGNIQEKMTAYAVPTLKQVIEVLDKRAILIIENGWEYRNDIYDILSECDALGYTAIVTDAKKSAISKWQISKPSSPLIVTKYSGTVVWKSKSYIKKSSAINAIGVILENNNAYSTTFSKSTVTKAVGKTRAVIDMTDPKMCGNRKDSPVYWDDVTSRGFSMIITDNVEQFVEYRLRVEQSRKSLENLIVKISETELELYSASTAKALKTNLTRAEKTAKTSTSSMEIENMYNELNSSYINLQEKGDKEKGGTTYTSGRIIAVIIAVIALVVTEAAFEILRNKSIALRKSGKKLFFSKKVKKRKLNKTDFE